MNMQEPKNHIHTWLPVMKELEAMGHNPVEVIFGTKSLTMEVIEDCYVALHRATKKYPEWNKVVSDWIDKRMLSIVGNIGDN